MRSLDYTIYRPPPGQKQNLLSWLGARYIQLSTSQASSKRLTSLCLLPSCRHLSMAQRRIQFMIDSTSVVGAHLSHPAMDLPTVDPKGIFGGQVFLKHTQYSHHKHSLFRPAVPGPTCAAWSVTSMCEWKRPKKPTIISSSSQMI